MFKQCALKILNGEFLKHTIGVPFCVGFWYFKVMQSVGFSSHGEYDGPIGTVIKEI